MAGDGVAVLPAILVPVSRRSECPWYASVCDKWRAYSVGLQLRAGRDDGNATVGVDVVLAADGFADLLFDKSD